MLLGIFLQYFVPHMYDSSSKERMSYYYKKYSLIFSTYFAVAFLRSEEVSRTPGLPERDGNLRLPWSQSFTTEWTFLINLRMGWPRMYYNCSFNYHPDFASQKRKK